MTSFSSITTPSTLTKQQSAASTTARHQRQLAEFKDDHERHTQELDDLIRKLHGKPANGAVIKHTVSAGKIVFADLMGDKAVLKAMKTNENDTNKAYERAASQSDLPQSAVRVIQNALGDERRHRGWLEKTIAAS